MAEFAQDTMYKLVKSHARFLAPVVADRPGSGPGGLADHQGRGFGYDQVAGGLADDQGLGLGGDQVAGGFWRRISSRMD